MSKVTDWVIVSYSSEDNKIRINKAFEKIEDLQLTVLGLINNEILQYKKKYGAEEKNKIKFTTIDDFDVDDNENIVGKIEFPKYRIDYFACQIENIKYLQEEDVGEE